MNTKRRSLALALLLPLAAACATDRQVIEQARGVHTELEPAVVEDPQLSAYLQEIGDRIIEAAGETQTGAKRKGSEEDAWMFSKDMRFHLVNSKTLNAFTTGGEHMYIYGELFRQCDTEDELAAVMAHEYAHVYARHVHKGINRQYTMLGTAALLGIAGYAYGGDEKGEQYAAYGAGLAMVGGQFLNMGFTRKDEAEADALGFDFYTRAGWDPARFGDFFQQMIDMGLDTTPEMASDHPSLASRVEEAKKRAAALPPEAAKWRRPPVASPQKLAAHKARLAEVAATMPSDQSLEKAQTLLDAAPTHLVPRDQPEQEKARARIALAMRAEQGQP